VNDDLIEFLRGRLDGSASVDHAELRMPSGMAGDEPQATQISYRKLSYLTSMSEDLAMDYGLIPDTRPKPPPPPWYWRLRWRVAELIANVRLRVGARIAGVNPEDLS
jgi:hypothetical protein